MPCWRPAGDALRWPPCSSAPSRSQNNFAFITVQRDRHNPKKALSMSWWLSMHVQKYLDDQLELDGVNKDAFAKIRAARPLVPPPG